tara:strand:+ start:2970 stop:3452 length:483 start_codon:yes stop_codon:yes gene_type:complete
MSFDVGNLVVDEAATVGSTNITVAQIRDLLNRPRGLNHNTIVEYLNIRIAEINKKSRASGYVGVTSDNAPTTTLRESAIKLLVCCDCLRVLIDTIPAVVPEKEQGTQDIRFNKQLETFEKQAAEALALIEEKGGTAFYVKGTSSKVSGTTTGELSGSLTS